MWLSKTLGPSKKIGGGAKTKFESVKNCGIIFLQS